MKKRQPDLATALAPPLFPEVRAPSLPRILKQAAPILLVIGAWLLLHPYRGIIHDARLYAAQALRALNPGIYDLDLFFAFGSQDQFTLFTRLYAPLVDAIGLGTAAVVTVALGHLLWLAGAAVLAVRLAGAGPAAVAGLLLLALLPSTYGGWQAFAFGEGFATPRPWAEAFGLWGLWALTHGRLVLAGALVAAGGLLHPIMAVTALLAGSIYLALRDPRWIALGVAGGLALAAGLAFGIAPFDRALATMDPEWLAAVGQRNAYLFPGQWRATDWSGLVLALALAVAGASVLSGWRRSLVLAAAAAAVLGVGVTWIGADLLHNVLLIQLQLYRTMWLLGVVAYLAAGILLLRIWALAPDGPAIVAFLTFAVFATFTLLPPAGAALAAAGLVFAVLRLRGRLQPLPRGARTAAFLLAGLLGAGLLAFRFTTIARKLEAIAAGVPTELFANLAPIDVGAIAVAALLLARLRPQAAMRALPALSLAVLAVAVLAWDRREPWSAAALAEPPALDPAFALPAGTQIFWENDITYPWYVLGQPSYVSVIQGAGIAFARDTALTYRRRSELVRPLMGFEMVDIYRQEATARRDLPALDRAALVAACAADRELGALVLSRTVEGSYRATWELPVPRHDEWRAQRGIAQSLVRRYHLYHCDDLRPAASGS